MYLPTSQSHLIIHLLIHQLFNNNLAISYGRLWGPIGQQSGMVFAMVNFCI
jgi:hypothetical protein